MNMMYGCFYYYCVVVCKTHISNAQTTQGNKCGYVLYMLRRKDLPPQGIRNNQKKRKVFEGNQHVIKQC